MRENGFGATEEMSRPLISWKNIIVNIKLVRLPAFYPILDTLTVTRQGITVISAAEQILEGGACILQVRHKGFFSADLFRELEQVAGLCRDAHARLVINDRADIARLLSADLHLGQEDLAPSDARRVTGNGTIIGFSTHNEVQFRDALTEPIDYVAFGPIFSTASKDKADPVVGVEQLCNCGALTSLPLVAIGGITRANARSVLDAGANSVAVIGDLFPSDGDVRGRVEEWLRLVGHLS
jgi:thiamine-phosphate pyrophosphorylase